LAEPIETKRRLAAIFAADVEGYSRLMGTDEVGTRDGFTERRTILDGPIGDHRGCIANTAGHRVSPEFTSAFGSITDMAALPTGSTRSRLTRSRLRLNERAA
jgi:adenylate cyclase